jgi:hypothetical protein
LVVADTIGCKLFYVPVFTIGGMQFFSTRAGSSRPITFLLTDIVNEFYGPQGDAALTLTRLRRGAARVRLYSRPSHSRSSGVPASFSPRRSSRRSSDSRSS